eukprot:PITA_30789
MRIVRRDVKFDEEKSMWFSFERELQIPMKEELIAPKEEPPEAVDQPQIEEQRVKKTTLVEPSIEEADTSSFKEEVEKTIWVDSMVEEYRSIVKNNFLEVFPRPIDNSIVGLRWIFKVKQETNKRIEKYKSRFTSKGYSQVWVIEYEETFPIAVYSSIRSILALAM